MKIFLTVFVLFSGINASAYQTPFARMRTKEIVNGKECFKTHNHKFIGIRSSQKRAMEAALDGWEVYSLAEYGSDWKYFTRGEDLSISCKKKARYLHYCKVKARPCRNIED